VKLLSTDHSHFLDVCFILIHGRFMSDVFLCAFQ